MTTTTTTTIPKIDLSLGDESIIADQLYKALTTIGFAILTNHGFDLTLRSKAFKASKAFFRLPTEEKLKYEYRGHKSNRGYIGCGKETHDHAISPDYKETYDINPDTPTDPTVQGQPWPDSLSLNNFQENLTCYFNEMDKLHLRILSFIELGLKLPKNYLVERCNERHENLRLLHYPEITLPLGAEKRKEPIIRGAVHTDFGTITLLFADSGGLMVQGLDKKWVAVTPTEDEVVVNVGDMLQRWTNDVLKANPHQVVELVENTTTASREDVIIIPERYSIAFFCNANKETILECLPMGFSTDKKQPKYKPVKAYDYITQRLSDTIDNS